MSKLVEHLRQFSETFPELHSDDGTMVTNRAADRIEALEAALRRIR
jgi:hypothetical protein